MKHGEKRWMCWKPRRRFVKVRSAQGVEGWTDSNLLLTPQQMDDLRRLADSAAKLPSQGTATVFDPLNVHADPSRQSPSFFQIPESGAVEVIGHRVTPRIAPQSTAPPVHRSTLPAKKSKGKESKRSSTRCRTCPSRLLLPPTGSSSPVPVQPTSPVLRLPRQKSRVARRLDAGPDQRRQSRLGAFQNADHVDPRQKSAQYTRKVTASPPIFPLATSKTKRRTT